MLLRLVIAAALCKWAEAESANVAAMRRYQQLRAAEATAEPPSCWPPPLFDQICDDHRWIAVLVSVAIYAVSTRTLASLIALRRRQQAEEAAGKADQAGKAGKADKVDKAAGTQGAGNAAGTAADADAVTVAASTGSRGAGKATRGKGVAARGGKPRRVRSKSPVPRGLPTARKGNTAAAAAAAAAAVAAAGARRRTRK